MNLYAVDGNGEKRKVKAIWKCINGKPVKLEEGTPEYFDAVREVEKQGVICYGT